VTDKAQPSDPNPDDMERIEQYRRLVLEYEALDEEIDALLAQHRGATENMSDEDFDRYRELAHRRDALYNQMKAVASQIRLDDETGSSLS